MTVIQIGRFEYPVSEKTTLFEWNYIKLIDNTTEIIYAYVYIHIMV